MLGRPDAARSNARIASSRAGRWTRGLSSSDAECALVGEKRRHAACVQEDNILVFAPAPLADQGDQAREPLARIDRIKWKRLEPACKSDRLDGGFVRRSEERRVGKECRSRWSPYH